MKRLLFSSIGFLVLLGCSSTTPVSTEVQNQKLYKISDVELVNWNEVKLPSTFNFNFTPNSQVLDTTNIDSPIGGFSFAYVGKPIKLEISGIVKDLSVFVPNLSIYDQKFQLIHSYSSEVFDYDRNDFIEGQALHGEVTLNLPANIQKVYAVIYTTPSDLEVTTTLIHPAKAFAIAKRVDVPNIDDLVATHSKYGEVSVSISEVMPHDSFELTSQTAGKQELSFKGESLGVMSATRSYYYQTIKEAVEEENLPKALSLLDEAKALEIEGVQKVFIDTVNSRK